VVEAVQAEAARFRELVSAEPGPGGELAPGTRAAYRAVREGDQGVPPLVEDRTLDGDIRKIRQAVVSGRVLRSVEEALGRPLRASRRLSFDTEPE
jgi:hypothetical protein